MKYRDNGFESKMRPATYTDKPVYCPKASILGYSKHSAERGDIIRYTYGDSSERECIGRVLGRVDSDKNSMNLPAVKGHIAVLELAMTGSSCHVRWIDPAWVMDIRALGDSTFIEWFFRAGDEYGPCGEDLATLFRHERFGSLNARSMGDKPYLKDGKLIERPMDAWEKK